MMAENHSKPRKSLRRHIMLHDVLKSVIRQNRLTPLIALKISRSALPSRWHAQRAVNSLRTKIPIEQIAWDIVILNQDTNDADCIFSTSSEIEKSPQSSRAALTEAHWQPCQLDW